MLKWTGLSASPQWQTPAVDHYYSIVKILYLPPFSVLTLDAEIISVYDAAKTGILENLQCTQDDQSVLIYLLHTSLTSSVRQPYIANYESIRCDFIN